MLLRGKWVASHELLNISSLLIPMAKHVSFTYSDDEDDEVEEDPEEDPVEETEVTGSPLRSDESS